MKICEICGEEAIVKAYGGEMMKRPGAWTDDAVPYPNNFTFRCKKHYYKPDADFGKLWMWYPKEYFPYEFNDFDEDKTRERQAHEEEMRAEYRKAEMEGYRPITED